MREFFRGWKRKSGVATLVMACVLTVGWIRSYSNLDMLTLATWNSFWRLTIEEGLVELSRYQRVSGEDPQLRGKNGSRNSWTTDNNIKPDGTKSIFGYAFANLAIADWKTEFLGFAFATKKWSDPAFVVDISFFYFQFRDVVIPLALLSAWLLLRKPRPAKNHTDDTDSTQKQPDPR
jgi:hypothetical protein